MSEPQPVVAQLQKLMEKQYATREENMRLKLEALGVAMKRVERGVYELRTDHVSFPHSYTLAQLEMDYLEAAKNFTASLLR